MPDQSSIKQTSHICSLACPSFEGSSELPHQSLSPRPLSAESARILREKGMSGGRLKYLVEEDAGHHELAWQWRLTGALEYLLGPWKGV